MIRLEFGAQPKHRAPVVADTGGWSRWPKHRDDNTIAGPAPADGMEEYQAKWVAAMKLREAELHRRQMAVRN